MVRSMRTSRSAKPRLPSSAGERRSLGLPTLGVLSGLFGEIVGKMMGKDVNQGAFELLCVGMAELGGGEFLEMIVQAAKGD